MDFLYKICKKCEIEKELEQFHKDTRTKDSREGSCKECKKKYQQDIKKKRDFSVSLLIFKPHMPCILRDLNLSYNLFQPFGLR